MASIGTGIVTKLLDELTTSGDVNSFICDIEGTSLIKISSEENISLFLTGSDQIQGSSAIYEITSYPKTANYLSIRDLSNINNIVIEFSAPNIYTYTQQYGRYNLKSLTIEAGI